MRTRIFKAGVAAVGTAVAGAFVANELMAAHAGGENPLDDPPLAGLVVVNSTATDSGAYMIDPTSGEIRSLPERPSIVYAWGRQRSLK